MTFFKSIESYTQVWKCAAVLKGDGFKPGNDISAIANATHNIVAAHSTTRYYKLGTISHPNQVPWH